jgi:type VI secretion system protein ImpM
MQCGLFGKLPSKRDFVSYNMPRPFLDHWEEWLQSAVAASKHALGPKWQEAFLAVPIWRFWFGSKVFGQAATGALMPSVDGIGRYFPLSICACEPEGTHLAPPPSEALDGWHDACERFLLGMLDGNPGDDPAALLNAVPFAPAEAYRRIAPQQGKAMVWTSEDPALAAEFKSLAAMNDHAAHGDEAYWWTRGGGAFKAQLVVLKSRPDPTFLISMMTGTFN